MKRRNGFLAAAVTVAVLFTAGCGAKSETVEVDINPAEAAKAIVDQVEFRDSLLPAEGDIAWGYYELDDTITEYAIYISGSGATAEEVAVLKVADSGDVAGAKAIAEARLETLKLMFENYRPDEMVKLGSPVLETRGNVVYFVTADDPARAKEAIDSLYA